MAGYFTFDRFLTYHCLLYNETSWCQPGSQPPLKLTDNQLHSLTHKTDPTTTTKITTTTTEHVPSTEAISQQSKTNAATGDEDKSNEILTSHSSMTNGPTSSNNNVHPQRLNQAHLEKLNATASDQGHSSNTQSNNQTHSQSLHTGMQL